MRVSAYDQYPSDGRPSRIRYWLGLNSWSVKEAALLFCDVPPDMADLDERQELIGCIDLTGKMYGAVSPMLRERYQRNEEEEGDENEEDWPKLHETTDEHGHRAIEQIDEEDVIAPLANRFRDLHRRLDADMRAGIVYAHMAPRAWIDHAASNGIDIPWLDWARHRSRDFPTLFQAGEPATADSGGATDGQRPIGEAKPGRRNTRERDRRLQLAANKLAKEWLASGKKPTRKSIAYALSLSPDGECVECERIERIIRIQWDYRPTRPSIVLK